MQFVGRWRAPKAVTSAEAEERSRRSQDELRHGRLPLSSAERLADRAAPFTSDLTTSQLAALRAGGWLPAGQVFGSAVITRAARYYRHPAYPRNRSWTASYSSGLTLPALEMYGWFDADRDARTSALRRLRLELDALGAHGAVGLRVLPPAFPDQPVAECTLVATALRSTTAVAAPPFVTQMGADDLVALRRVGYVPCASLFTLARYLTCSWSAELPPGWRHRTPGKAMDPRELQGATNLATVARRTVRTSLASQLTRFPGAAMVMHDLDVTLEPHECEGGGGQQDLLADVVATATAIVPATARSAPPSPGWLAVQPVVPLTDRVDPGGTP